MYLLNLVWLLSFIGLQIGCLAPQSRHSQTKVLQDVPSGSQVLYISYFNPDSGRYCAIPELPPQEYLYYDKYIVNEGSRVVDKSMTSVDSITHKLVTTRTISYPIDWYDLINLDRQKYTRYTSFSASAVKKGEGTISKQVNLSDFKDLSLTMSVAKELNDTVIDHRNFKRVLLKPDTGVLYSIAYFEQIKMESPLQISKILSEKYKATLVKFEMMHPNGNRMKYEMVYQPGSLTKEQVEVITQWIKNEK